MPDLREACFGCSPDATASPAMRYKGIGGMPTIPASLARTASPRITVPSSTSQIVRVVAGEGAMNAPAHGGDGGHHEQRRYEATGGRIEQDELDQSGDRPQLHARDHDGSGRPILA